MKELKTILICAAVILVVLVIAGFFLYHAGGNGERATQATAQVKQDKKTKAANAKIDNATPFVADKRTALDWLYQYGRQ